jgi:hypothetical protein
LVKGVASASTTTDPPRPQPSPSIENDPSGPPASSTPERTWGSCMASIVSRERRRTPSYAPPFQSISAKRR